MDISINSELGKIVPGFPATELIEVLLRHVAIDTSNYVRDVQSSSQIYFRSHKAYNAIQELIKKVESSQSIEWDAFDHYTLAIPHLESILFNYYKNADKDKKRAHLPPTDGVEDAVIFVEMWKIDRDMLEESFKGLSDDKLTKLSEDVRLHLTADHHIPRNKDDLATIRAFQEFFTANKLLDRGIMQEYRGRLVTNVKAGLTAIWRKLSGSPSGAATGIAIRTMMLAYIPFAMIVEEKTPQDKKNHLRGSVVWKALENLVGLVKSHLETQAGSLEDLEKEWEIVKTLLLNLTESEINTLGEILELLKLAANIRRPLHGRTVQLIKMLYYLDQHSANKDNKVSHHRAGLKEVMIDSIDKLEVVKKKVTDVKTITLTSAEYTEQAAILQGILSKVKGVFGAINLDGEWSERQSEYQAAVKIDEDHLNYMRQRVGLDQVVAS